MRPSARINRFWGKILRLPMPIWFSSMLQSAAAQGSRSTVLRPLSWLLAIGAAAVVATIEAKAPQWVVAVFVVVCALTVFIYLCAYLYCLFNDRDALRSETYSIQKLAIEKGYGDSGTGVLEGGKASHVLGRIAGAEQK